GHLVDARIPILVALFIAVAGFCCSGPATTDYCSTNFANYWTIGFAANSTCSAAIGANCLAAQAVNCVLAFEHLHHDRVRAPALAESSACWVLSPDASMAASAALTD